MLEQPHNEPIDGRPYGMSRDRTYVLKHDYIYQWNYKSTPYRIVIPQKALHPLKLVGKNWTKLPEDFIYDGASVPRFTWTVSGIRPDGLIRAAALVHDFIYIYQGKMPKGTWQINRGGAWMDVGTVWSRKQADRMFARLLREAGMSKFKRRMAYRGVRAGGWAGWNT